MQESGLPEIIRLMIISAIWDQHPVIWFFTCFTPPHSGEWWQTESYQITGIVFFFAWAHCGFRNSHLEGQNSWWLWHPCLLLWQERLRFIGLTCGGCPWQPAAGTQCFLQWDLGGVSLSSLQPHGFLICIQLPLGLQKCLHIKSSFWF